MGTKTSPKKHYQRKTGAIWQRVIAAILILSLTLGLIPQNVKAQGIGTTSSVKSTVYSTGDYRITYEETNAWDQYVNVTVTIENTGQKECTGWRFICNYAGQVDNIWNGKVLSDEDRNLIIGGETYNCNIPAGGCISFGFIAHGKTAKPEAPVKIQLNCQDSSGETDDKDTETGESGNESGAQSGQGVYDKEIPEKWKGLRYAVYTSGETNLSIYANETNITGSVHSNAGFIYQGTKITVDGILEASKEIYLRTSGLEDAAVIGGRYENAESISMPDITEEIVSSLDEKTEHYEGSKEFQSDTVSLEHDLYVEEDAVFHTTRLSGSGILYAGGSITYNIGSYTMPENGRAFVASKQGDITINGSDINLNAVLYAPHGTVTINANNFNLNGRIIAEKVIFHGTTINIRAGSGDYGMLDFLHRREFLPPIADLELQGMEDDTVEESAYYLRDGEGKAYVDIINKAASDDGDEIESITYLIYYDSNNDGAFSEDELIHTESTLDSMYTFIGTLAGHYRVNQFVQEVIADELKDSDYTDEEILELTSAETVRYFEIGNIAPESEITLDKENAADILMTYYSLDEDRLANLMETKTALENGLEDAGIDATVRLQEMKTADTRKDFDFTDYIHEEDSNYRDIKYEDLGSLDYKQISFTVNTGDTDGLEGSGIIFGADINEVSEEDSFHGHKYAVFGTNYTWPDAKTFCEEQGGYLATITSQAEYDYIWDHIVKPDMKQIYWLGGYQEDTKSGIQWKWITGEDFEWNKWATGEPNNQSEGALEMYGWLHTTGYWNDTFLDPGTGWDWGREHLSILCEWNGTEITGYILIFTEQGIKLIYLDHADMYNLQNISYEYLENAGTLVGTYPYDMTVEEHNILLTFTDEGMTISDNGAVVAEGVDISHTAGSGIGEIISCNDEENAKTSYDMQDYIKDLVVTWNADQSLQNVIESFSWRGGAEHVVICAADDPMEEMENASKTAGVIKALAEIEADFAACGNASNEEAWKQIILVLGDGYCDVSAQDMSSLTDYILDVCKNRDLSIETYITTDDIVNYQGVYIDRENDPLYRQYWQYDYVPDPWNSADAETVHIEQEEPMSVFEHAGAYTIKLMVQDNPVADYDALSEYRLWSDEDTYERLLLVQTRPYAEVQTEIIADSEDEENCIVNAEYTAWDEDHPNDENAGIRTESFAYKKLTDPAWTDGRLPNKIEKGSIYLVRYMVEDIEGSWSRPAVCVVDTTSYQTKEPIEDTEVPVITLKVSRSKVSVSTPVTIEGYATDNYGIADFKLYIEDKQVLDTIGKLTYVPYNTGTITIKAVATDLFGNTSEKTAQLTVYERTDDIVDDECPVINVEGVALSEDGSCMEITGTITDNVAIKSYEIYLTDENVTDLLIASGDKAVTEVSVLATIEKSMLTDGEHKITIQATDTTGNRSTRGMTITTENMNSSGDDSFEVEDSESDGDGDRTCPVIEIGSLSFNEDKTEIVLTGSITDETELKEYHISLASPDGETIIAEGEAAVPEISTLAVIPTENLVSGEYQIIVVAVDSTGNTSSCKVSFTYTKTTSGGGESGGNEGGQGGNEGNDDFKYEVEESKDRNAPHAEITSPAYDETLNAPVEIIGSAYDEEGLAFYRLEYRMQGDTEYQLLTESTEAVENGVLGTLDTTMLQNGRYQIRLWVQDKGGNTSVLEYTYLVEGNLKVGAMNIGFTDLSSYLNGINVSVNRMYDSRRRTSGDFGYGWSMGVQGINIYESGHIWEGYQMTQSGSLFATIYQLSETVSHDVIITYGDGTSDKFELVIQPSIQALVPISEVTLSYRCMTDPSLSLEIVGDTSAMYAGGELAFYNEDLYDTLSYRLKTETGAYIYINGKTGVYKIEDINGNVISVDESGYHSEDGKSILFTRDEKGRITTITAPSGKEIGYTYDEAGDLVSVTDVDGTVTNFVYEDHYLTEIIDARGVSVGRNVYDENGRLIKVIDADGNEICYDHDIEGREEIITDRLGGVTRYVYDDNGNILQTTDQLGNTTYAAYDEYGNVLTRTDAMGNVTSYTYDANGKLTSAASAAGNKVEAAYSSSGKLTSITQGDLTTFSLSYDSKGRLTTTTDALGNDTAYTYDTAGNLTSLTDSIGTYMYMTYDDDGNVLSQTDGLGNVTTYTYDEAGNQLTSTYTYTTDGVEVAVTDHYSYDENGNMTGVTDSEGNTTTVIYNSIGKIESATDAAGNQITYSYDDRGNLTTIRYEDGTSESFTYDEEGRNLTATDRLGRTVTMTYDKVGNLTAKTYPNGAVVRYAYDANYNLISATNIAGGTYTYSYDDAGRLVQTKDPYGAGYTYTYNEYSLNDSVTDALGNTTHYEYDGGGNCTKVIYADGNSTSYTYDERSRLIGYADPKGYTTHYEYDISDQLTSVTDALGGKTSYAYDEAGNLVTVIDANGNKTNYSYDELGRLTELKNAAGKKASYRYDSLGNLTSYTGFDGATTSYTYDSYNRLSSLTDADGTVTYSYTIDSKLSTVKDSSGIATLAYDDMDRLEKVTGADGRSVSYSYDKSSRLTGIYTEYGSTTYTYDKADRLTDVADSDGNKTHYSYDANGNLTSVTYPDGMSMVYTYDQMNCLIKEQVLSADGEEIERYEYTLGTSGERIKVKETSKTSGTFETEYTYDKLYRLTGETIKGRNGATATITYTYDSVGNRTSKTENGEVTTYTYNELNQLISDSNTTYRYDANGNLVSARSSDRSVTYSYNASGMMTEAVVTENGNTTKESYEYDAFGNRVSKTTDGNTIYYLNDIGGSLTQVMAELDSEGHLLAYYNRGFTLISRYGTASATAASISETDMLEAEEAEETEETEETASTYIATAGDASISEKPEQAETSEQAAETKTLITSEPTAIANEAETTLYETVYYITDGHGSVRILTDEAGNITDRYDYDAYGSIFYQEGMTDNHYLYAGEQQDEITGLYYLRARYMDVETGRFTSMDSYAGSIFDPVSLHKYLYANANPVMYTDPSGYLSSADITAGTIIQANLINTGMSVYLTVLHKLYAASKVDVEEFQTISGGDWAFSLFESAFGSGFFINNLILCLAMTNIAGACVMIGVVGTVMCMLFTIAAADAALDENDALEQYYGMMAVLSLAGAFFGFDQAMKEAGVTADQLAVAKENASVVTDSNIDINHTTVPEVSGGSASGNSSKTSLVDLPENVQNSFNKYDQAGWKGNVSGQTPGTNAGRKWGNRKSQLPTVDANGNPILYKEFDVNNFNGVRRDGERFIAGSDGSIWYTDSHYGEGVSLNGIADFICIK